MCVTVLMCGVCTHVQLYNWECVHVCDCIAECVVCVHMYNSITESVYMCVIILLNVNY